MYTVARMKASAANIRQDLNGIRKNLRLFEEINGSFNITIVAIRNIEMCPLYNRYDTYD